MGAINFDFNFWTLAILVSNFALGVYNAMANHRKVASDDLKAMRDTIDGDIGKVKLVIADHGERLARMEGVDAQRVTHEHLAEVYRDMKKMDTVLAAMNATLSGVQKTLEQVEKQVVRMDQFWRNKHD